MILIINTYKYTIIILILYNLFLYLLIKHDIKILHQYKIIISYLNNYME